MTGLTVHYLYRHKQLSFRVKISHAAGRSSVKQIQRWIADADRQRPRYELPPAPQTTVATREQLTSGKASQGINCIGSAVFNDYRLR
jgi:hypothetical protein